MSKQGYNARLDESLGAKHPGEHKQSLKSRRHESESMEIEYHGHKFGSDAEMGYRISYPLAPAPKVK
tara:strand:- start:21 stop:221 length:201 start_codon:yes stop_codon:yes gene_type:complete